MLCPKDKSPLFLSKTSFPNSMAFTMTILTLEEGPLKIHDFPKQIMLKGKPKCN